MAVQQLRQVDLAKEHLLFVTLGERPTSGYSLSLSSAQSTTSTLQLAVTMRSPAPGTMTAQVITSPCVVVAVPARDWSQIRVSGVRDQDLVLKP
nr:protease complex subunit PrcB family protein [Marinobacter salexigens]